MKPDYEPMEAYWKLAKDRVDAKLREMLADEENEDVRKIYEHALMDGKRVRSTLVSLVASALGGDLDEALAYGALIESTHSASLVLDDVFDNDSLRRKNPTLWRYMQDAPFMGRGGREVSMLAAEGLVARAMFEIRSVDALRVIVKGMMKLFRGFVQEAARGGPQDYEAYIAMLENKTGSLFEAAALLGAVTSPRFTEEKVKERVQEYGRACGIAFQLADDILDGQVHQSIEAPLAEVAEWVELAQEEADHIPVSYGAHDLLRVFPAWMVWKKSQVGT